MARKNRGWPAAALTHLLAAPDISPATQQLILQLGESTKNDALLAQLAAHPAVSADVDAQLATKTAATIREAWLGNPRRTTSELLDALKSEKRATVLRTAAGLPGLPKQAYTAMVDVLPVATLPVLIANTAAPGAVRVSAAKRYAELLSPVDIVDEQVVDFLLERPAGAEHLFAVTACAELAVLCARFLNLTAADRQRLVEVVHAATQDMAKATKKQEAAVQHTVFQQVFLTADWPVTNAQRDLMAEALTNVKTQYGRRSWDVDELILAVEGLRDGKGRARHKLAQEMLEATDTATALKVAKKGVKVEDSVLMLVLAASEAPGLSAQDCAEVWGYLRQHHGDFVSFQSMWGMLRNPAAAAALYVSHAARPDLAVHIPQMRDPGQFLVELSTACVRQGIKVPLEVWTSPYLTPELFLQMPVPALLTAPPDIMWDPQVLAALDAQIQDVAANANAWESLMTLSNEFDGSMAELFDVCRAL